jgi:hypothetical protein
LDIGRSKNWKELRERRRAGGPIYLESDIGRRHDAARKEAENPLAKPCLHATCRREASVEVFTQHKG